MNEMPKLVISRTLERADWANTRLIRDNVTEELRQVKQQPGKDIAILGSSALTVDLLPSGLVDELRIMVSPIILGTGKSLFKTADERIGLTLLEARPFTSGNVLLRYTPAMRSD
jgi:dihydrofolate reductase